MPPLHASGSSSRCRDGKPRLNLSKLSPGFSQRGAGAEAVLCPCSVHPPGHRHGCGTVQLRSAGHAGAVAAGGGRGEDLQQDWRGPGMVEGGDQRKGECTQRNPCAVPAEGDLAAVRTAKGRGCVPLPVALWWVLGGLAPPESHLWVAIWCFVTVPAVSRAHRWVGACGGRA